MINLANKYIKENENKIDQKYRLKYHFMPPIGWANDPNGLVFYKNKYHVFYQFYPYKTNWGPMHWGHIISDDLIDMEYNLAAIAPNDEEDKLGCWSGGAIALEDELDLVFTGHGDNEQKQFIARSKDGINFIKDNNPCFDNKLLPKNVSRCDFRDPYPIYVNGSYYILVGGRLDTNEGVLIVLKSNHMAEFRYDFMIGPLKEFGIMCECPTYAKVDGYDVILASGIDVKKEGNNYKNSSSSIYLIGHIDFEKKKMDIINSGEIDKGDTFYAPQIINNCSKPIMIAWMEMWNKDYPTAVFNHGWNGAFTFPRLLSVKDNILYQNPIDNINKYYKKSYEYHSGLISRISDINIKGKGYFKLFFKSCNGSFEIGNDKDGIYLNTLNSNNLNGIIRYTNNQYDNVDLRILLDVSSIELFVNDGIETITSRIFLDSNYEIITDFNVKIFVNEISR